MPPLPRTPPRCPPRPRTGCSYQESAQAEDQDRSALGQPIPLLLLGFGGAAGATHPTPALQNCKPACTEGGVADAELSCRPPGGLVRRQQTPVTLPLSTLRSLLGPLPTTLCCAAVARRGAPAFRGGERAGSRGAQAWIHYSLRATRLPQPTPRHGRALHSCLPCLLSPALPAGRRSLGTELVRRIIASRQETSREFRVHFPVMGVSGGCVHAYCPASCVTFAVMGSLVGDPNAVGISGWWSLSLVTAAQAGQVPSCNVCAALPAGQQALAAGGGSSSLHTWVDMQRAVQAAHRPVATPPPPRAQMAKAASRHTTGAAHAGTVTPMLQARLGAAADARRALQPPCCCSCCPGGVLCRAALRSRQPVRSGLLPLCAERRNAASTCACCPPAFPGLRCCRMPYNHAVAAGPSDVGMMQVSAVPSINHTSDIHREAAGGAQGGL